MQDPVDHAIAYGAMMLLGALLLALLKRWHFEIRSKGVLVILTMTLWGVGMGLLLLGLGLLEHKEMGVNFGSFLIIAGLVLGLGAGGLFFSWITDPNHHPKKFKEPIESSFAYRLGQRIGKWVRHRHP